MRVSLSLNYFEELYVNFDIGFIESDSRFILNSYAEGTLIESKTLDLLDLKSSELDLVFYRDEEILNEAITNELQSLNKFYPILNAKPLNVTVDYFSELSFEMMKELYSKTNRKWVLTNNLSSVESLYPTIRYFKELYQKDLYSFYEELWFYLKSNLGSNELKLIFTDIKEIKKAKQKEDIDESSQKTRLDQNKLFYSMVIGNKHPNVQAAGPGEIEIIKGFEKSMNDHMTILEENDNNSQYVLSAKIELSPIVIMAKTTSFNELQKSLLKGLFSSL
jgi:hypothetical protein